MCRSPSLLQPGPLGTAPAQKSKEGLGAHSAWNKVPHFFVVFHQKQNGAGSLVERGHEGWECAHTMGRGQLARRQKLSSKFAGKQLSAQGEIQSSAGAAAWIKPGSSWACPWQDCAHMDPLPRQEGILLPYLDTFIYQMNRITTTTAYISAL